MPRALLASTAMSDLTLSASPDFPGWLRRTGISLAFTTYQAGKAFFIGARPDGQLSVFERTFARCMGMWSDGQTIWMASHYQLWRFENQLKPGETHDGHDAVYTPLVGVTTGDLDVHDVTVDADGRVVFANTLFNCLATTSHFHSFKPLWRPDFISDLVPEDRCHLNGIAVRDGRPRYVSCVSTSDVVDGWRERRHDGGVIIDVETNQVVCSGLSMPHSPRWHDDRLWVLNSGAGYLGYVEDGRFNPVTLLPGYARGMAIVGHHAVVGLSRPRHNRAFTGLPIDDELAHHDLEPHCGLLVIDLSSGAVDQWLRIEGAVQELYDVVSLPEVSRPMALGFKTDAIQRMISIED